MDVADGIISVQVESDTQVRITLDDIKKSSIKEQLTLTMGILRECTRI